MAVEFRLTLAGDLPLDHVADLVAVDAAEKPRPSGTNPRLFSARFYDTHGYALSIYSGSNGYFDAEGDDGTRWEWEPETYVDIDFSMRADDVVDKGIPNMMQAVARVLAARQEDAALVQNGNWLLLTRVGGELRRHRSTWWSHYGVDGLITR
ncbi:SitI3 family protein [Micromonospora sp. NBC_01638]|uniref:SitI3 family protein n=1 Tax=Micromonospora sp. NBC_01638 TaxID=2975982 RepID=UPI0038667673|nr:SitI3 family protein [Micromonospora sp. NBC_01638]